MNSVDNHLIQLHLFSDVISMFINIQEIDEIFIIVRNIATGHTSAYHPGIINI